MIKKNRKNSATPLNTDALADTNGGVYRWSTRHKSRKHPRTRTFLTMEQKMNGHTKYSTDGHNLYYRNEKFGKMKDLL